MRFVNRIHQCFTLCILMLLPAYASSANALQTGNTLQVHLAPDMDVTRLDPVPQLHVVTMADAILEDADLLLDSLKPYHWLAAPGEVVSLQVAADSPERGDKAFLTFWNWQNQPIAQHAFDVPFSQHIDVHIEGKGVYLITLDRFDNGTCVSRLVRNVGITIDNTLTRAQWVKGEFFIGAAMYPGRQHWRNRHGSIYLPDLGSQATAAFEADLNARLGIQVARLNAAESGIQIYLDRDFLLHLKVWPRGEVATHYRQAMPELGNDFRLPRTKEAATRSFASAAARWGQHAFLVQFLNEPDHRAFWLGTAEEYIEHYHWAYPIFREAAPQAALSAGGFALIRQDMLKAYVHELREHIDWITYHTHGPLLDCIPRFRQLAELHAEAGYTESQHYVNTEMGSRAWRLDRERHQAIDTMQKTFYFWSQQHRGVSLYESRDLIDGPGRLRDSGWGHVDYHMCPRFVFGTVSAMIDLYAGANFREVLIETNALHVYRLERDGRTLLTLFRPDDSRGEVSVQAAAPASHIVDAMGNAAALGEREVKVNVGGYPTTIIWPDATGLLVEP